MSDETQPPQVQEPPLENTCDETHSPPVQDLPDKRSMSDKTQPPPVQESCLEERTSAQDTQPPPAPGKLSRFLQLPPPPSQVSKPKMVPKACVLTSVENLRHLKRKSNKRRTKMK